MRLSNSFVANCLTVLTAVAVTACGDSSEGQSATKVALLIQLPEIGAMSGMAQGTIEIDDGGCVRLHREADSDPIVWPHGTTFDEASRTIQLDDGTVVRDGDDVVLGGGYDFFESIQYLIDPESMTTEAKACVAESEERNVFVLAPGGVQVNPAQP